MVREKGEAAAAEIDCEVVYGPGGRGELEEMRAVVLLVWLQPSTGVGDDAFLAILDLG